MFYTREGQPVPLIDRYRGSPAFLIAGGPSFASVNKSLLSHPGVLTYGYNNVVKTFRPHIWSCVDHPTHFLQSIWQDPLIEKFCPLEHADKRILDSYSRQELPLTVGDCPNVWFYRRNNLFNPDSFLFEETINWGDHGDWGGCRSGILPAFRILFLLGVRTIYLLGFDFKMDAANKYCFDQDRTDGAINNNNQTYQKMTERFKLLRPIFENNGLQVFNCNPDSALRVFDFRSVEDAVTDCTGRLPKIDQEPTSGLYERLAKKPKERHRETPAPTTPALTLPMARELKRQASEALRAARETLRAGATPEQTAQVRSLRLARRRHIDNCNGLARGRR